MIQGIEKLPALKHLSAVSNDIRTLTLKEKPGGVAAGGGEAGAGNPAGVRREGDRYPAMSSVLESLYLAKNDIASLEEVLGAVAKAGSSLQHLSLAGNPLARADLASPRDARGQPGNASAPPPLLRAGGGAGRAGGGADARNDGGGGGAPPREGDALGVGGQGDAVGPGPAGAESVLRELDVDVAGMVGRKGAGEEAQSYKWRVLALMPSLKTMDGEEIVTRMREEALDLENRRSIKEVRYRLGSHLCYLSMKRGEISRQWSFFFFSILACLENTVKPTAHGYAGRLQSFFFLFDRINPKTLNPKPKTQNPKLSTLDNRADGARIRSEAALALDEEGVVGASSQRPAGSDRARLPGSQAQDAGRIFRCVRPSSLARLRTTRDQTRDQTRDRARPGVASHVPMRARRERSRSSAHEPHTSSNTSSKSAPERAPSCSPGNV